MLKSQINNRMVMTYWKRTDVFYMQRSELHVYPPKAVLNVQFWYWASAHGPRNVRVPWRDGGTYTSYIKLRTVRISEVVKTNTKRIKNEGKCAHPLCPPMFVRALIENFYSVA